MDVGPTRADRFGLRAQVEVTAARHGEEGIGVDRAQASGL
jgi:hypothetical protein